jgi:hypothetical protein
MNMFELVASNIRAVDLSDLGRDEVEQIKTELRGAIKHNKLVSVQVTTMYDHDNEEEFLTLYGVYTKTTEEVADYNADGGLWSYSDPTVLLDAFDRLGG